MYPERSRAPARVPVPWLLAIVALAAAATPTGANARRSVAAQSPSPSIVATPASTTFGDALAGLVQTLRAERGHATLVRESALDHVADDQAAALALARGVAGDGTTGDASILRAAVIAAGWDAPPDVAVARAYAVRRSLEQAADWLASPDNPDGAALFDGTATAIGAATATLADGRIAWVVVVASGALPPSAASVAQAPTMVALTAATGGDTGANGDTGPNADLTPPFAVTALPAARGEAFGPALPDTSAPSPGDPLAAWTPALQDTARIVVALIVGGFALTALRLRGGDRN